MSLTILLEPKSHVVLENKVSFQHNHLNLPKVQILKVTLTVCQVIPFPEIELENKYDHEPQLSDSIQLLDSIMTPVSLPDFNLFPESALDPVPIHHEIESPIFDDHIELDQFYTFESPIDKLASSHFYDIELMIQFKFLNQY